MSHLNFLTKFKCATAIFGAKIDIFAEFAIRTKLITFLAWKFNFFRDFGWSQQGQTDGLISNNLRFGISKKNHLFISSHSKKVWNQLWCVAVKARSILGGAISEHQGEQKLQREFADKRISIQWPDKPFFFFFLSKVLQQNFNSAQGILGGAPLMHPYLLF